MNKNTNRKEQEQEPTAHVSRWPAPPGCFSHLARSSRPATLGFAAREARPRAYAEAHPHRPPPSCPAGPLPATGPPCATPGQAGAPSTRTSVPVQGQGRPRLAGAMLPLAPSILLAMYLRERERDE